jgi:hypothetical protein
MGGTACVDGGYAATLRNLNSQMTALLVVTWLHDTIGYVPWWLYFGVCGDTLRHAFCGLSASLLCCCFCSSVVESCGLFTVILCTRLWYYGSSISVWNTTVTMMYILPLHTFRHWLDSMGCVWLIRRISVIASNRYRCRVRADTHVGRLWYCGVHVCLSHANKIFKICALVCKLCVHV